MVRLDLVVQPTPATGCAFFVFDAQLSVSAELGRPATWNRWRPHKSNGRSATSAGSLSPASVNIVETRIAPSMEATGGGSAGRDG